MLAFQFRRCCVHIHFSIFALLAFCCIFTGIEGGAILLFATLFHEAAHVAAAFLTRTVPHKISISALGCRMVLDMQKTLGYGGNLFISLAGPISNLILGFVGLLLGLDSFFVSVNLTLGVFHLLPIEPLDGGLAFHAFLSMHIPAETSGKISRVISFCFLIPMAVLGFLVLLRSPYNFSLLALALYLMLYLLLKRDFFQ